MLARIKSKYSNKGKIVGRKKKSSYKDADRIQPQFSAIGAVFDAEKNEFETLRAPNSTV